MSKLFMIVLGVFLLLLPGHAVFVAITLIIVGGACAMWAIRPSEVLASQETLQALRRTRNVLDEIEPRRGGAEPADTLGLQRSVR